MQNGARIRKPGTYLMGKKEFGQLKKLFPEIDYPNKHSDVEDKDPVNKPPNVAINTQKHKAKMFRLRLLEGV